MSAPDWRTIGEVLDAARTSLAPEVWDMAWGGSGSEATMRRNARALAELSLVPRVLTGAGRCDLGVEVLGRRIDVPFLLAPVGEIASFDPAGAAACARAAAAVGTGAFISAVSSPSLEDVREATEGPLTFQLYVFGDRAWRERLVRRVEGAGYDALCLTVDTPVGGRLDGVLRRRLPATDPPVRPNLEPGGVYAGAAMTWDDVAHLRQATTLPLVLKGIMHPDDAVKAVALGAEAVCVSNHGARQLDDAPATIEVLPEIVAAVDGRAEILVDSGFLRGSDVVKALALGARAVLLGRLMVIALAAGGEAGLVRTLELLATEIENALLNVGGACVADLGPGTVRAGVSGR